ncbi:DegT/DnrJ/EryC1/StrS family aminotransferase [Glaciecola sp. SC05]|uniref:DegT/DnrJ/EryC1/StrS family aminotransferase n=1 Tax=Glaciecola sp. SC05 TaxID=1987355 RepID=UPI0035295265
MIPVNKPYLPAFEKYTKYLELVYQKSWLTNNGPLVQELKARLEDYLGVKNLLPVANGTLAMQLAYKVLKVKGNAVTTPFTFIATSSSLAWEGIKPKFADIDSQTYNLCPLKAELAIDRKTTAIVPVHVYGNPCNVEAFEKLGQKHSVKIIYDAAHAFGVKVGNRSVLSYGDASTLSFHATKVFHSVEGGAVIFRNSDDYERALLMTNFGINTKSMSIEDIGINAKMSEVHAAMGLAVLDDIEFILEHRKSLFDLYNKNLTGCAQFPQWHKESTINGSYMPISFLNNEQSDFVLQKLQDNGISARRYFSPSLNHVDLYMSGNDGACSISADLALRTLCLPLYASMSELDVIRVSNVVKDALA